MRNLSDYVGIQYGGHVGAAKQTFQYLWIHGQQSRAALGLRHVVLVHDRTHESEKHAFREWRRRFSGHIAQCDRCGVQSGHDSPQRRQVVHILQAFARGLQQ